MVKGARVLGNASDKDVLDDVTAEALDTFRWFVSGKTNLPTVMTCFLTSGTMELS